MTHRVKGDVRKNCSQPDNGSLDHAEDESSYERRVDMGVSENRGTLFWSPYYQDPTI